MEFMCLGCLTTKSSGRKLALFFFFATASLNALHGDVFISYYLIQQQMGLWGEVLCLGWQVKTVFLNNNNKVPDMIPRQSSNPTND